MIRPRGSTSPPQLKRKKNLLEEEGISRMFSTSLSCLTPTEFAGKESSFQIVDNKGEAMDEREVPEKKIRMTSKDGYVSVKLPNGKLATIEFKGQQIFAYQLHLLIEESTGFTTGSTSMMVGGKILGKSDHVQSNSKISLVFLDFHRSEACISET